MICFFHKWIAVKDVDHSRCGHCFMTPDRVGVDLKEKYPEGYCPHSFTICMKCGKAEGYGSHGKLTGIPDTCKAQIKFMRGEDGAK